MAALHTTSSPALACAIRIVVVAPCPDANRRAASARSRAATVVRDDLVRALEHERSGFVDRGRQRRRHPAFGFACMNQFGRRSLHDYLEVREAGLQIPDLTAPTRSPLAP